MAKRRRRGRRNRPRTRQKDKDARWTKKHGQSFYGYKNHVNADAKHKLIRRYEVSDAAVHDSQKLDGLLNQRQHVGGRVRRQRLSLGRDRGEAQGPRLSQPYPRPRDAQSSTLGGGRRKRTGRRAASALASSTYSAAQQTPYILLGGGAYLSKIVVGRAFIRARQPAVQPKSGKILAQLDAALGFPEVSLASDPSFYPSHACRRFPLVWPSAMARDTGARTKLRAAVAARSVAVRRPQISAWLQAL